MSTFIIQVTSNVYTSNSGYHAYRFAQTAIESGHSIIRVFFYQDGVSHSNTLLSPASDELNLHKLWCELANKHNIELINCVSAALRRGFLAQQDAKEINKTHWNIEPPFIMGGLGELVTGIEQADRLICF